MPRDRVVPDTGNAGLRAFANEGDPLFAAPAAAPTFPTSGTLFSIDFTTSSDN
jgi:hypothetical protein